MREASPQAVYLKDYKPPAFLIDKVDLYFDLREVGTSIRSRLTMRRNGVHSEALRLDGEGLTTREILLNGEPLSKSACSITSTMLQIDSVPDHFTLETVVEIAPESNTVLEGLYRSGNMFCTQCEAEGFRRITWYLDRPDVMALFTTTIEADKATCPVLLSNGNPVASDDEGSRHRVTWDDPFPKPSYLFALVAGDLALLEDSFVTMTGREIALRIYSEPENIDKCDHAMASLKCAMRWDEEEYGREYDLDIFIIVAVNDFNMGAMENKGLNIFNAKLLLARPDTATDADYQSIEAVVAHEYFHNWTGNRITCRDWFQLSLKEGFTVYRDQEFSADMGSRGVKRIEDVRMLRAHQFAEDASPMAHPVRPDSYVEINNFYTLTVYEKGAEVVRMQANLLGRERFREATDLYFERHDGQAVTTDDFVTCMEDASGRDLEQFKRWYSQAGTPEIQVISEFDSDRQTYDLTIEQSTPATPGQENKSPFVIPIAMALLDPDGKPLEAQLEGDDESRAERVLELTQKRQTFRFVNVEDEPVPSLLRGFSAPIKLACDYSNEQLLFLIRHDTDGFVRWDAAQTLHQRILLKRIAEPTASLPAGYLDVLDELLQKDDDLALTTELLTLPSESYLGDQMDVVDVDGIHAQRKVLRAEIAHGLHDSLLAVYERLNSDVDYAPSHQQIAARALKNHCLALLAETGSESAMQLVVHQYNAQHNMTDVMAALTIAAHGEDAVTGERLLEDFAQRWKAMPLVMDKWFSVQATSPQPDALTRIEALRAHPAFTLTNPNRVRALIGAMVMANPVTFHRSDGAGYRLLADTVIELNALNPQIAARLLRQMSRWRRYDSSRQSLMKTELERIAAVPDLSKDVQEITTRSLA